MEIIHRARDQISELLFPHGFTITYDKNDGEQREPHHTIKFEKGDYRVVFGYSYCFEGTSLYIERVCKIGEILFRKTFNIRELDSSESIKQLQQFPSQELRYLMEILEIEGLKYLKGDHTKEPYIRLHVERI